MADEPSQAVWMWDGETTWLQCCVWGFNSGCHEIVTTHQKSQDSSARERNIIFLSSNATLIDRNHYRRHGDRPGVLFACNWFRVRRIDVRHHIPFVWCHSEDMAAEAGSPNNVTGLHSRANRSSRSGCSACARVSKWERSRSLGEPVLGPGSPGGVRTATEPHLPFLGRRHTTSRLPRHDIELRTVSRLVPLP